MNPEVALSSEDTKPGYRLNRADSRRIGEIIQQYTNISPDDIQAAVKRSRDTGLLLGEQLIQDGKLTSEDRAKCLSIQWGLPYCNLKHARVSSQAVQMLDSHYQMLRKVLCLQLKSDILYVGIIDPLQVDVVDDIRLITGYDIKPIVVSEEALEEKYAELFEDLKQSEHCIDEAAEEDPDQRFSSLVVDVETRLEESPQSKSNVDETHNLHVAANVAAVIQLVNSILGKGIEQGASDIHLQSEGDRLQVRYRVDGILHDGAHLPGPLMRIVVARIKVMANMDLASRRTPQDGRMALTTESKRFEGRVSVLPSVSGVSVVLRVAEQNNEMVSLEKLGFQEQVMESLVALLHLPHGMFLITGPTGSGKSTTLYSALKVLNTRERKILTVEDPVESKVEGVAQAEINERAGLSFAACLRAALRQDPDIIMVGEIRDRETAAIATQASLTGHFVLSTLHTNDAPSAVTRLVDMGIEPFLVASSLEGVLAQRLARRLCVECKSPYTPTRTELKSLQMDLDSPTLTLYKSVGCGVCQGRGYRGRVGVYELLKMSDSLKTLVLERKPDSVLREVAIREGMITLKQDVLSKMLDGLTSMEEAHRVVSFEE
ncbi:MAG: ATPase, T2SS/T4P/T4SS family [Planctomycetota bacterium]|nr:ATPase, T2SS/T4P/T4SS family [Planctomycetota bacterium]